MGDKEEIFEDQIEVINSDNNFGKKEKEPVVRCVRDEKTGDKNPLRDLGSLLNDIRRLKVYGFFSVLFGFFGIFFWVEVLPVIAIVMGGLDIALGSKLTRKISIFGIVLGVLGFLNAL